MKPIRILHLPSYHPAVSKIYDEDRMLIANPHQNSFSDLKHISVAEFVRRFPLKSYDIVHIHFEYYLISLPKLKQLLQYFKKHKKPIVWTWHDKKSLLDNKIDFYYEKLLFQSADKIITLTNGMEKWIRSTFGKHKYPIEILAHGFIASLSLISTILKKSKKDKNLFTLLIGDFREPKEYIQSIINFLQSDELKKAKLQVIFRPLNIYSSGYKKLKWDILAFHQIIQHPRVRILCKVFFNDKEIAKEFYKSHAVILPYKWGDHSGQIELAKDCGCHVIVSDVGFYKEQWDKIWQYKVSDNSFEEIPERYVRQLVAAFKSPSLSPLGSIREKEHKDFLDRHYRIYTDTIKRMHRDD